MKTLKQHIRKLSQEQFDELNYLTHESNKLYNCALWIVKEYFKETNKYIGYNKLYHEIKNNIHYQNSNSICAQQIIRLVDKDFRSFFALLKRKNKGNYITTINTPKFKKKNSQFILSFTGQSISFKNNILRITKKIKIPFSYNLNGTIKQVIIKPTKNNYYVICIQYEENKKENLNLSKDNILGIDLGLNNLVSCLSNIGTSFIVSGKPLKSYNQYWNKRKSLIQSELQLKNKKKHSNLLSQLSINRNNYIDNYLNQTIALIIKQCKENNIGKVICGYNETWKKEINLGKVNNQSFTNIPHQLFKQKLENKCKEWNIDFILTNESYTSKCSFLDNEKINKHEIYLGQRIKRGLFKTSKNILCNADIQAAGNIIRKVVPNAKFVDGIEGVTIHPKVLNLFNL